MKVRLFGSHKCPECKDVMEGLDAASIPYTFIDALAKDTQKLCDKQNIDDLPHLQVLDEHDKLVYEHVGYVPPMTIMRVIGSAG